MAVEDRPPDRADRIGQEMPMTINRLIVQDSIEDRLCSCTATGGT
jgi:SNF2 family DNA or RNA helicase